MIPRRRRRTSQSDRYSCGEVTGAGSNDLRTAFRIKTEVLPFCRLDRFQTGLNFLLDAVGRDHLVKHNSEMSVPSQPACGPRLQHRALNTAALR